MGSRSKGWCGMRVNDDVSLGELAKIVFKGRFLIFGNADF